ncbi:MAG: hypothetical protein JSV36_21160 [Anaerolineae bacterium]|nr:MAG: hypothetical protein JSV36_21160 [Anaerolineae bacterium]
MREREEKGSERRRYPSLVWPILLITAGALFLLSNLGVLEINFWELWRLWPLLLILAGLEIILGRRSFLGSLIVLIVTIAVVAGVVIFLVTAPDVLAPSVSGGVDRIVEPLEGIERASLKVDFAAGQLDISALSDSTSLIEGDLELATERKPAWEIDRKGSQADMTLEYKGRFSTSGWRGGDEWHLHLSPNVGLALEVDVGAGRATIDLTGLDIRDLSVSAGASQSTVVLPREGNFAAEISGGVGGLVLEIPEEMAARIQVDRGLGALDVSSRFEKEGDVYQTDDWDTSDDRVDLQVDIGVGLITVREP